MQEMKKRRIVLASVLKPVDDTRMFEKLGSSLAASGIYDLLIIGYPSRKTVELPQNITLSPLTPFKRISLQRLMAPFKIAIKAIQVKPNVLIVNTHELLIVGVLNKILFGTKIIYDIQENYWRNILWTNAFPMPVRLPIALWVRLKEKCLVPFFDWSFLAENGYENEMRFLQKKITVLKNKVRIPKGFTRQQPAVPINLLFSGTIAESTGVFEAIDLAEKLHELEPSIHLHIIGFCAKAETHQKLLKRIENLSFITLTGGNKLVPHEFIFEAISKSHFGLIYYPSSPHTQNSIPTKLYEYMGCLLPIALHDYQPWTELTKPFQASINIDFSNPDSSAILQKMRATQFYTTTPDNISWESEEHKLLDVIQKLMLK